MDLRGVSCRVGKWKGLTIISIGGCSVSTVEPLCPVDSGLAYCSCLLAGTGITAAEPSSYASIVTAYCCCIVIILLGSDSLQFCENDYSGRVSTGIRFYTQLSS